MPFGFINTFTTFQIYINQVLIGLIDNIYIIYLDNILIYFKNKAIYITNIR